MGTTYSAAIVRGWRFTYDDLVDLFNITPENENDVFDMLYDTNHFYCNSGNWDSDACTYYLGLVLVDRDAWDGDPISLASLEYTDDTYNELSRLWYTVLPNVDMPTSHLYLFPQVY